MATVGGRIYIVGGNDGTAFLNTCEVYDPISDRWTNIAPMNTARAGIGCAVEDGILYAAGKHFSNTILSFLNLKLSFYLSGVFRFFTIFAKINFMKNGGEKGDNLRKLFSYS